MRVFSAALSLTLLAGSALAAVTQIVSPIPDSSLTVGSQVTVQVSREITLSSLDEVAIVIALAPCSSSGGVCYPASDSLGNYVLYQGPFNPVSTEPGVVGVYQNFTVTIPESVPTGSASLNILNLYLVGVVNGPVIDYLNQTMTVVA